MVFSQILMHYLYHHLHAIPFHKEALFIPALFTITHTFRAQVPMIHQSCYRSYCYSHYWICKISAGLPLSLGIFKIFAIVKVYVSLWPTDMSMILHPNCLFQYSSLTCAHLACTQNDFLAMHPKQ